MTDLMLPATQYTGLEPKPPHLNDDALVRATSLHSAEILASTTWKVLAPLMAAQPTMRLWNPGVRFNEIADLTKALPAKPAAVPVFWMNRTRLLALDLDAKHYGRQAVLQDLAGLQALLDDCGAATVVDVSASGGAHVLIPLEIAVTKDELIPLLAALAIRYRTLDLSPMQNDSGSGCITVPGSRCREGGFRVLVGSLARAGDAFRRPNPPSVLHRLGAEIGADEVLVDSGPSGCAHAEHPTAADAVFSGTGVHRRLVDDFHLTSDIPVAVEAFACKGTIPSDGRWPSPSEARQSVLYHAAGRGSSLADMQRRIARGGQWEHGLGAAYRRYKHARAIHKALARDWDKACNLHLARCRSFHASTHKTLHTGVVLDSAPHKLWLTHAIRWCDTALRGEPRRWSAAAVLQSLAVHGVRAGATVNGTVVVAVGVRALSLASGLLSKETVAAVLQMLRECPGSPVLHVQESNGVLPDGYALVTPDVVDPDPGGSGRPELVEVHDAWSVVGAHHRRVYELLESVGSASARDLAVVARMSVSATYETLAELCRRGLVVKRADGYMLGENTLDEIGRQWRVSEERERRIETYGKERRQWKEFLGGRRRVPVVEVVVQAEEAQPMVECVLSVQDERDYENAVMANGPPVRFDEVPVAPMARGLRKHRRWWWTDSNPW